MSVTFIKQVVHMVMDLKYILSINRRKFNEISVNNLVVKFVNKMAADNKLTTLKFEKVSIVITYQLLSGSSVL